MSQDEVIRQVENYVECWKQFNQFLRLASAKRFSDEEEEQFLELKSVLAQELELILAQPETSVLRREEIHDLLATVPSLRLLADGPQDELRQSENRWHKIYIQWQSVLGQMKAKQRAAGGEKKGLGGWFR